MAGLEKIETRLEDAQSEERKIMEEWWVLSADHELANSTSALLLAASSCIVSGLASCYGLLHIGAAESAHRLLRKVQSPEHVETFIQRMKKDKRRMVGIGHRTYKTKDPRVEPVKNLLKRLKAKGHRDPLIEVALEFERQVITDSYFIDRKLVVNVDLCWPFIYTSL